MSKNPEISSLNSTPGIPKSVEGLLHRSLEESKKQQAEITTLLDGIRSDLESQNFHNYAEALRRAHEKMEIRIKERTGDLLQVIQAIQESEKKYRLLVEQASDGIFILDREGNIKDVNPMSCQMLGFTQEELVSMNVRDLIPQEDLYKNPSRLKEVLSGEKIIIERRFRHKNGTLLSVEVSASLFEDGRVQTIVRDMTERKKAEEALRRSEERLAEAQRIAHFGNWDWNIRTNELHWSDEVYRIFGLTPKQFGATYDAFLNSVHPDDREFVKKAVSEALYGEPYNIEHRIILPDGTIRIVHEQGEVTFGESGEPVRMLGTIQDVTDKKENELRLIISERLAALGQMASGIAHEINNPLATISACAEGILSRIRKGRLNTDLIENYLKIIDEEVTRCKGITTSMLSFVRKTSYENRDFDINYLLDKTVELLGFQGRLRNVTVIRNYTEKLVVHGNEGDLRQVFLSIIVNALDAMEDRGVLTIETGIEKQNVFIIISDSGPGISQEYINKIFNPFFTTRSEKGGTGLGLSIAKEIISDNKGKIEVISEPGKGASFKVILQK